MTNEPSPRPWRVEASPSQGKFWICRTTLGVSIGETWKESDAVLIVAAVNERDRLAADEARYRTDNVRLRDIVRRLSRHLANYITSESENDLLREARAAIGEDKP